MNIQISNKDFEIPTTCKSCKNFKYIKATLNDFKNSSIEKCYTCEKCNNKMRVLTVLEAKCYTQKIIGE